MMRRYTVAVLTVVLAATLALPAAVVAQDRSDVDAVTASANRFAIDLYRQIGTEEENMFFSPYSIYTILALMYGGASGETAEEMAAALHLELESEAFHAAMVKIRGDLSEIQEKGEIELSIANSLWPQAGDPLVPEFLDLAESYLAEFIMVDYRLDPVAVRDEINAWAEKLTNGRITEIVDWDLHSETHLLLANAIFFKGNWASRFDEADTTQMPFHISEGEIVEVPMMRQMGHFRYGDTTGAQLLELPYEGDDLALFIILPWEIEGLPAIEEQLTAEDVISWQEQLYTDRVDVYLPRFQITSAFDLRKHGDLKALGIIRALHQYDAEFPGVGPYANWFSIQRFVHKAFVDVNEEGTEAAAVTVGGCFPAGTLVQTPNGRVTIETVEAGTVVQAFDLAKGQWNTTEVAERRAYQFSGEMLTLEVGSDAIEATWNHPFLVVRGIDLDSRREPMDLPVDEDVSSIHGRWVEARDIRVGDVLLTRIGRSSTVTAISSRHEAAEVYVLEIDDYHNHAVGRQGILVHNGAKEESGPPSFVADHPFLFFIRDKPTGNILFMGRVGNPGQQGE